MSPSRFALIELALLIALVIPLCTCRTVEPSLTPRVILDGDKVGNEFWLAAPYILVIKVIGVDVVGAPRPIYVGGPNVLQALKIRATVENVIQGTYSDGTIVFWFLYHQDQPSYSLEAGARYIVAVRREGNIFRSWADASQLKIEVFSGYHQQRELLVELGPEKKIAYILLTPGTGYDRNIFIGRGLHWPYPWASPLHFRERLRNLELGPDPELRDSACITEAQSFGNQPACLRDMEQSPDPNARRSATLYLTGKDDLKVQVSLEGNPLSFGPRSCADHIQEMLEIYTDDIRPKVRAAACADLKRLALSTDETRCPSRQ